MYCLLNLCYVFHFRKGKWAVWATKIILNTHMLCLSARLLTFNHPLAPISLPRLYCSGKQLQINTGRCEQPGNFECNSGIHKNPRLCTCTTVNVREDTCNAEMLFITFPILPRHKGYFLIKQVTGITASALMTKWRYSGKQIKPVLLEHRVCFDTISKHAVVVDYTIFYGFF